MTHCKQGEIHRPFLFGFSSATHLFACIYMFKMIFVNHNAVVILKSISENTLYKSSLKRPVKRVVIYKQQSP